MSFLLQKLAKGCWIVVKYGCLAYCTTNYVVKPVVCLGESMEPTIHPGDVVLALQAPLLVSRTSLEAGDVIIAQSPEIPEQFICKRITAVQGDTMKTRHSWYKSYKVPKCHVWLEGDNKSNSIDSRDYGPVPVALVYSRVVYKIWPLTDFGPIARTKS